MFCQDFEKDFDAVLATDEPFALVRFGDGEAAIVAGLKHDSADAWSTSGPSWLRSEIIESLRTEMDGWCVGLPTRCCLGNTVRINPAARVPRSRQTFATLFLHANLNKFDRLRTRFADAMVVSSSYGDVRVPADCVSAPVDLDGVVAQMLECDQPILLAAGPASNVLALRYWKRQAPERRQIVIDVGSALDLWNGRKSRHFHEDPTFLGHRCDWKAAGPTRPTPAPRTANPIVEVGRIDAPAVRVDRPTQAVTTIGRQTPADAMHVGPRKITMRRR